MHDKELEALIDRIADTAAHIDAATHMLLTDIRVLDESGAWFRCGAQSCAAFLSWRIGLSPGAARERVRVARALGNLPCIDEALAHGLVSYSKVRALARVATPQNEQDLLEIARCSTAAQLEKICRMYAQVRSLSDTDPEARARDLEERRWVSSRPTDDGMVRISIQLRPEEAATVLKAIDNAANKGSKADRLVALAENALSGDRVSAETVRPPVEVMFHIDAQSLEGHAHDTGDGVSAETGRRLLCDSAVIPVLEARGETVDVGRKTRTIPPAIRRALIARDGGCCFPGCHNRRFVDAHHIEHWVDGGETKLSNLALLCRMHHRYVHEYNYSIDLDDERNPVVRNPAGDIIPPTGERHWLAEPIGTLRRRVAAAGIRIDPAASIPDWDGTRPQYDWIIDSLTYEERQRSRAVSGRWAA